MLSSIQSSSVASCSGLKPTAPSTPNPGLADGGHDVPAVGEGEDGELDIQTVTDLGVHGADDTSGRGARTRSMGMPSDVGAID